MASGDGKKDDRKTASGKRPRGGAADPKIPVEVEGMMMTPTSNQPIVLLRLNEEKSGKEERPPAVIPIWIGFPEALAIKFAMENDVAPRPMTHDLLKNAIELVGATVMAVVVRHIENNTFFAEVELVERGGERRFLDARPSDAIALALRAEAPIFVRQSVADCASFTPEPPPDEAAASPAGMDKKTMKEWFEDLDPKALGKYEM